MRNSIVAVSKRLHPRHWDGVLLPVLKEIISCRGDVARTRMAGVLEMMNSPIYPLKTDFYGQPMKENARRNIFASAVQTRSKCVEEKLKSAANPH